MRFFEINQDAATGLSLVGDHSEPTRYYLLEARRRHLLSIGERDTALQRFALWVDRFKSDLLPATSAR
jgi:hypothetical protein